MIERKHLLRLLLAVGVCSAVQGQNVPAQEHQDKQVGQHELVGLDLGHVSAYPGQEDVLSPVKQKRRGGRRRVSRYILLLTVRNPKE